LLTARSHRGGRVSRGKLRAADTRVLSGGGTGKGTATVLTSGGGFSQEVRERGQVLAGGVADGVDPRRGSSGGAGGVVRGSGADGAQNNRVTVEGVMGARGVSSWIGFSGGDESDGTESEDDFLGTMDMDLGDEHPSDEQPPPGELSAQERISVDSAARIAERFAPAVGRESAVVLPDSTVRGLLREAVESAAISYGTRAAEEWAEDFSFSPTMRERDGALLAQCEGDFGRMVAAKRVVSAGNRLSERRVRALVRAEDLTDEKDFERLLRIARGIRIQTPDEFVPSGFTNRPPLRRKYQLEVSHAVNKLLAMQWEKDTVLLLPTEVVARLPGIHFSPIHWVLKSGKPQGRVIGDTSNPAPGSDALNGTGKDGKDAVRRAIMAEWGRIVHPTLRDLVLMILRMVDRYGAENLRLWKMDLAAAFNLMDFEAASAILLAFELTEGMSAVHTTGMFGWTGTPYVFQTITRVMVDLCRKHLEGLMLMYVDDMLGVSHVDAAARDMEKADGLARGLLGPNAVADDKTECERAQDWLGWHISLDSMTVSASRRNLLKAVHAFFFVDLDGLVALSEVERMASYASRYSVLCPQMKPYSAALHGAKKSYRGDRNVRHVLSAEARCDIVMWRAYLCLLRFDPANFARSLDSFRPRTATVKIEFDASLTGLSALISTRSGPEGPYRLVRYTSLTLPFAVTTDSSYQNTCEYLAVLLGLLLIRQERLAPRGFAYELVGDSVACLSWCARGRAVSSLARAANVCHSLLAVDMDSTIVETTHIAGKDNVVCDGLSRGKTGPEMGLPGELWCELSDWCLARQVVRRCDPGQAVVTAEQHVDLSRDLLDLLGAPEPSN
jgi:hypothetical protein